MSEYLKPYKWTYLNEVVESNIAGNQRVGNFRITNGISKPRHVFVFIINTANIESQTANPFLYNTFSVSTNPRTLDRCYLEVGNGNEYPDIHYKPSSDPSIVFRDVMPYVYTNNDFQGGTLLNRQNFENIFAFVYFDLTKQKLDIKDGVTKLAFHYELSGATATNYNIYASVLHEREAEIEQQSGLLNLFSSLASLGARLLPLAMRGVSKVAPALAPGTASALGEIGLKKLFGKGITILRKYIRMLPPFAREFTKSQRDQINKAYQTGGRLVIKPTRRQVEGGFLGTLASIGIPMAISLVSKMFGSGLPAGAGLQVDRHSSSNTANVYVPQPPPSTHGEGHYTYPYRSPPYYGSWENPVGMGVQGKKKSPKGKIVTRKKQPI